MPGLSLGLGLWLGSGGAVAVAPVIQLSGTTYSNTTGASGQWYADGVAIGGQTGSTLAGASYLNMVVKQVVGGLESNELLLEPDLTDWVEGFTLGGGAGQWPNGTDAVGFNGWTGWGFSPSGKFKSYNGGLSQYVAANARGIKRSTTGTNFRARLTGWFLAGGDNTANARTIYVRYTDDNNHISLFMQASGWRLITKASGSTVADSTFIARTFTATDVMEVRAGPNNRARVFINGFEAAESIAVSGGPGWDASTVPVVGTVAFQATSGQGNLTYGDTFKVADEIAIFNVPATGIQPTSVTLAAPDLANGHPYPTAALVGKYNSSTTRIKVCVIDSSGNVLQDFSTPFNVTGNTFSATIPLDDPRAQGGDRRFVFVDADDHTIASSLLKTVGYYAQLDAIEFGMNANTWNNYGWGDVVRDRGLVARFYQRIGSGGTANGTMPLTSAGWPDGTLLGGGYDRFCFLIWEGSKSQRSGAHTITFPPGMTGSFISLGNITGTPTVDSVNGTASITVTNTTSSTNAELQLTGTPTAGFGTTGVPITCIPTADANPTRPVTDQFVSDYGLSGSGLKVFRFMKVSGAEDSGQYYSPRRYYSPEFVAQTCNLLNVRPWITIPVNMTQADQLDFAQRLYAALDSNLSPIIEVGNELWNTFYGKQMDWVMWSAANAGLVSGVTGGSVINGATYNSSGTWTGATNPTPTTAPTNRTFNQDDIIYAQGVNYQKVVVRAKVNTSIGDTMPGTVSNSQFEILALYNPLFTGLLKQQARLQVITGNIFKGVFGSRAKSVLGGWLGDSNGVNICTQLAFENAWQSIDGYAPSAYIGAAITYDPNTTWHYNHIANQADFVTNYRAQVVTDAGSTITSLLGIKSGVETYMRGTLLVPSGTTVPVIYVYEAGIHDIFRDANTSTDNGNTPGLTAASITGNTLTVTSIVNATDYPIKKGMEVKSANSATSYGYITAFGTGTGGTGTYTLSVTQGSPISSASMQCSISTAMAAALAAVKQDAGYGSDLATYYYTPLVNKIGGVQAHFVDYEDFAVVNGTQIENFGTLSQSQGGRTNEVVWDALTDAALANP